MPYYWLYRSHLLNKKLFYTAGMPELFVSSIQGTWFWLDFSEESAHIWFKSPRLVHSLQTAKSTLACKTHNTHRQCWENSWENSVIFTWFFLESKRTPDTTCKQQTQTITQLFYYPWGYNCVLHYSSRSIIITMSSLYFHMKN